MQNLNDKDLLIIRELRKNSRATLTEMSACTKMPISTIHERLKSQDVIKRHTCLLDFSKLGFNTIVNIFMRVHKPVRPQLKQFLLDHPNMNSVYKVNSGYDFMVEGVFRNIKEVEEFLERLEEFKVKSKQIFFVVDELAKEKFMSGIIQTDSIL